MPGCIPLFTSDGLDLYFYALTAHFWGVAASGGGAQAAVGCSGGAVLRSGQEAVSPPSAGGGGVSRTVGALADIKAKLHELGVGRFIHTAFVERLNPSG
jgi:hypothetical protein